MALPRELLPWLHPLFDHLRQYIAQQRIPQALLITGQKGLGQQHLAEWFAFSLLCADVQPHHDYCGRCDSCLLLAAGTHPDYFFVEPDEPGKAITIAQIRNLLSKLTLKPQFEAHRVVIINPAGEMNKAAANAFLKCLEEPAQRTVIILITDKPASLPATIISRCQKLSVGKPDKETYNTWLRQQDIHDDLELLYGLSQGAPLLAQCYANEKMLMQRKQCFKDWIAVARQQSHPVLIAENWHKLPEESLIFWITSWVIDLIKCCYQTQAGKLYNPDLYQPLQELSQQLELKRIYRLYDLLLASRQRLATQINKQSLFEELLIDWFELNLSK